MPPHPILGDWSFDAESAVLTQNGQSKRLEDRAARTLSLLCRRRGETVTKAQILDEVWQGRVVSDNSVAVVIADLRRALGDDARAPTLIETVAKRGYRLNSQILPQTESALPAPVKRSPPATKTLAAVGAVAAALIIALAVWTFKPVNSATLVVTPVLNETGSLQYDPLAKALGALVEDRTAHFPGIALVRIGSPAANASSGRHITLSSRLIIWNDTPTLSMSALDASTGKIVWTEMAVGKPDAIASVTIGKLAEFRHLF